MSSNMGKIVKVTLFGESHGPAVGVVIEGLAPNVKLDLERIEKRLRQRRPGQSDLTTGRNEQDRFEILSGAYDGKTSGTPLTAIFPNTDRKSEDYEVTKKVFRPGHADYTGYVKSAGANDPRGGGHFSARLTAPLVFAGAIAEQLLEEKGIKIAGHISRIGKAQSGRLSEFSSYNEILEALDDAPYNIMANHVKALLAEVEAVRDEKDSVGATVEVAVFGLPIGLGSPFFDTVESRLSYGIFSIPAVKGVSFGDGFDFAKKKGSEVIDAFVMDHQGHVKTNANHNGGINGGITNGMPLLMTCVFKPTASIGKPQETLDFDAGKKTLLEIKGRHDPCVALRAVPIVKAVTALVILDLLMVEYGAQAYER